MKLFKNITAVFAAILILFAGCKNPAEDVQIIVNTDIFKSPVLLQFVNAKRELDGPQSFDVTITGPGASLVRTTTGGKNFKVAGGLLNLFLDRTATPSPTNPIKFTVVANAAGYAPTYQDVIVTSEKDPIIYRVSMNQYANPAANTGAVVATKGMTNGTAVGDQVITTATNAGMALKSSITIPSGTVLLDAAGQPVGGDQVEVRVVHYSEESKSVMPGGSFASNIIDANGQPIAGGTSLNIVGAVSIDMFYGSKEVAKFSKPVLVDIEVNNTLINPATNQAYKENETLPMWSLDDLTGQWKSEGTATIVKNGAGALVARLSINHLSLWSIGNISIICNPMTVTINKSVSTLDVEQFTINSDGINYFASMKGSETSFKMTIPGVFGFGTVTVTNFNGTYVNNELSQSYFISCDKTPTFNFVAKPDLINVEADIQLKCASKDLLTGVNTFVKITPVGGPVSDGMIFDLVNGIGSATAQNGVTYKISASVDGIIYTSEFKVEKANGSLSAGGANGGFGGTSTYNAATNTLTIKGLVTKNCN